MHSEHEKWTESLKEKAEDLGQVEAGADVAAEHIGLRKQFLSAVGGHIDHLGADDPQDEGRMSFLQDPRLLVVFVHHKDKQHEEGHVATREGHQNTKDEGAFPSASKEENCTQATYLCLLCTFASSL